MLRKQWTPRPKNRHRRVGKPDSWGSGLSKEGQARATAAAGPLIVAETEAYKPINTTIALMRADSITPFDGVQHQHISG